MARGLRWPRSASVWGGKRCRKSLVSRNQIPFSLGTAGSSRASSTARNSAGRWDDTRVHPEIENLVVRLARDNSGWGYDRIVGALVNLEHQLSDQTVGNILRRHGIPPAPKRSQTTTWKEFIRRHMDVLSGADFFTVEGLTWKGLVTYYVLFFIHLDSRRVTIAGITAHPDQSWMQQIARNATLEHWGYLNPCRYVLHDRDQKFCASFRDTLATANVKCLVLP